MLRVNRTTHIQVCQSLETHASNQPQQLFSCFEAAPFLFLTRFHQLFWDLQTAAGS